VIQCTAGGAAAAAAGAGGSVFSSHAAAAEHRQSLQRLVRALGGRVCGARAAEVREPAPSALPLGYIPNVADGMGDGALLGLQQFWCV
jgi:hypothetical protein